MWQARDPGTHQLGNKRAADRDDTRQRPGAEIDQDKINGQQGAERGNLEIAGVG
jgi:hypothetical protein